MNKGKLGEAALAEKIQKLLEENGKELAAIVVTDSQDSYIVGQVGFLKSHGLVRAQVMLRDKAAENGVAAVPVHDS